MLIVSCGIDWLRDYMHSYSGPGFKVLCSETGVVLNRITRKSHSGSIEFEFLSVYGLSLVARARY